MNIKRILATVGILSAISLPACTQNTPVAPPTVATQEDTSLASYVDMELENWDDIALNIIYNKDKTEEVINEKTGERYDQSVKLAQEAEEAVKAYFSQENTLSGENAEYMASKKNDEAFELKHLKALEVLAYDKDYTGVYVAAIVEDDEPKEVLFEIAYEGDKMVDFRLRDTNMDGTGDIDIFSPADAYFSIKESTGRITKTSRS